MPLSAYTLNRLEMQLEMLPTILEGVSAGIADRRPDDGGWSVKENLAHLARHAQVFLERMNQILREDKSNVGTYRAEHDPQWALWINLSLDEILVRLRDSRARLVCWAKSISDEQTKRTGIHPLLGEMEIGRWVEFFLLHEAHHLYYAMRRIGEAQKRT
jgi:hypothetical protein